MIQIKKESSLALQSILLTCMPMTPNRSCLKFAVDEIYAIDTFLPDSMKKTILLSPTKSEVLERIEQCSVAHFACHGEVNLDPSKSRLLFSDWETKSFFVADMAQKKLDQAELAYISACHTANNRNVQLLDESIHMAGAFQLAGFQTVIGTLWRIEDEHSVEVAKCVYHAILTAEDKLNIRNAARGLHFAIRKLRELLLKKSRSTTSGPVTWAPYRYTCRRVAENSWH
jgi:CHAT domain-containing protein